MGCCGSKERVVQIDVPRNISTTDNWVLRQKSFSSGCKLSPFTAACPASYPYEALTRVVVGQDHLFAAMFDGIGGSKAARHCLVHSHEILLQHLKHNDPDKALRETFNELDKSYFASDLPELVKACVGATGLLVFISTTTNKCFIARLGNSIPFLAKSTGSFNNTTVEVKQLRTEISHRSTYTEITQRQLDQMDNDAAGHLQQLSDRIKGKDQTSPSKASPPRWHPYMLPDEHVPSSSKVYTKCIGLGYGKNKRLNDVWLSAKSPDALQQPLPQLPFIHPDCEVTVTAVNVGDESIVLASEGLLEFLSPHEMGVMLHHFNSAKLRNLRDAYLGGTGDMPGSTCADGTAQKQVTKQPAQSRASNVASILVHHAMTKAIDKHNAKYRQKVSYASLQALDLKVDVEAFRPAGSKGAGLHLELPPDMSAAARSGALSRRDIHGDMGVVVISLEWPGWEGHARLLDKLRGLNAQQAALAQHMAAQRSINPAAHYHWQLLRLMMKFRMSRRRHLLQQWWQTVEAAQHAADDRARQTEIAAWRVLGEVVQISRTGDIMEPDTPPRLKASPHVRLSQAKPSIAASSYRSVGAAASRATPPKPASSTATPPRSSAGSILSADRKHDHSPTAMQHKKPRMSPQKKAAVGSFTSNRSSSYSLRKQHAN
eukprot:jgi/Chrzof1/8594/Cz03g16220.t1